MIKQNGVVIMESSAKHKRLMKPKQLDRRNAVKNINYDAYFSPSSSISTSLSLDESSSLSSPTSAPTPRSRSLDLDPKQSFRIKGIEGEFELICQTLGFSGPEDFAIPTSIWEAEKARRFSLDSASTSRNSNDLSAQLQTKLMLSKANNGFKRELLGSKLKNSSDLHEKETQNGVVDSSNLKNGSSLTGFSVRTVRNGNGGGINGERQPSVLTPPPVMIFPRVVDNVSSTWDILKSFAPNDDDEEDAPRTIEENEEMKGKEIMVAKNEVDADVDDDDEVAIDNTIDDDDEPCLSPSNDNGNGGGDDIVNTTNRMESMVQVNCISPNGKFRRNIYSWQKGELLGSGSFGTVYEGFTE